MRPGFSFTVMLCSSVVACATANKPSHLQPPKCRSVHLSVPAAADNIRFIDPPDQNNATAIQQWLYAALADPTGSYANGTNHVSGAYSVEATSCEHRGARRRQRTLQVLVHGITYNKEMWTGLGFSDAYNWHAYAARAGYHTTAINCLGHGQLTGLPDPITEDQSALQDKFTERLLIKLRQGMSRE